MKKCHFCISHRPVNGVNIIERLYHDDCTAGASRKILSFHVRSKTTALILAGSPARGSVIDALLFGLYMSDIPAM